MTNAAPIVFEWTDEGAMKPLARFAKAADDAYCVGETYRMEVVEARSVVSHNHQFAWVHDAWLNLPEDIADLYPSSEHLRKRALIEAGYCDETTVDAGNNAAAIRVAATIRALDDFAYVVVRGSIVIIRRAKSQSIRAMGNKDFQASKRAILDIIAGMIGVQPEVLQNARAA